MIKLGLLGAGNMGSAIFKSISSTSSEFSAELYAFDKDTEKTQALSPLGVTPCKDENELVSACDYILLAVKPQVLGEVLDTIKESADENKVFISICAGISAEFIKSRLEKDVKTAVVMPNTPAMLGLGASAIARDDRISDEEFELSKKILSACGMVREVPSDKMKEIICINGSSPAFIYLFAKGFVDYAQENGIDSRTALELFAQTLVGSAKMLTDSGMTVDELIKQVSSPGGTTLAGLDKLYEGKLTEDVKKACEACTKRAYELSR